MAPATDDSITVRMETGQPGTGRITVHIGPDDPNDLRRAFEEFGFSTSDIIELSIPEVLTTAFAVSGVAGSQLLVFAKALSLWFHRHDGKEVEITMNDQTIRIKGMSDAEIARTMGVLRREWDAKWRKQLPDRFPSDPGDEPQ
jgi:hypothetical protein